MLIFGILVGIGSITVWEVTNMVRYRIRQSKNAKKIVPVVEHARIELEKMGMQSDIANAYILVIKVLAELNSLGIYADEALPVIRDILEFKNLSPLTDDPAEWEYRDPLVWTRFNNGLWHNVRNENAMSDDGGKHYFFVPCGPGEITIYNSIPAQERST